MSAAPHGRRASGLLQELQDAGRRPPRIFRSLTAITGSFIPARSGQIVDRAASKPSAAPEKIPEAPLFVGHVDGWLQRRRGGARLAEDWTAAALDCPALQTLNPFDGPMSGLTAKQRDASSSLTSPWLRRVWDEENPLVLAARRGTGPHPHRDQRPGRVPFQPGARALADALKGSGRSATFRESPAPTAPSTVPRRGILSVPAAIVPPIIQDL